MAAPFIKTLREERNLSQADIAKKLGMSRPTYVALEQGKRVLTLPEAECAARMFGVSLDDFALGRKPKTEVLPAEKIKKRREQKMRVRVPKESLEKFRQVLLYVLSKTAGKPNVGQTVLYKLFYFIDFDYYEKYDEPLMGLRYIKNHHGPSPRMFSAVVKDMERKGKLEEVKSKYFSYEQTKYLPRYEPDLTVLSARELEMIDDVLARYADKNAAELSHLSHEDPPWVAAKSGENLDYELVFYRPDKLSVREYDPL